MGTVKGILIDHHSKQLLLRERMNEKGASHSIHHLHILIGILRGIMDKNKKKEESVFLGKA